MKKALAIGLVLLLSISMLAGCGGGGGSSSEPSGQYFVTAMEFDGTDMLSMFTEMGENLDGYYIEFVSGGNCRWATSGNEQAGTFKMNGSSITITMGGEDITGTFSGNKVTLEQKGDPETEGYSTAKMVYEKK